MIMDETTIWKNCSSCKKPIYFLQNYYLCSVSTCKHPRTGSRFCSVSCWDAHLGYANHTSAFAEEARAPNREDYLRSEEAAGVIAESVRIPKRVVAEPVSQNKKADSAEQEVLVVVSRVKSLVSKESGFNTSQCCIEALSKKSLRKF